MRDIQRGKGKHQEASARGAKHDINIDTQLHSLEEHMATQIILLEYLLQKLSIQRMKGQMNDEPSNSTGRDQVIQAIEFRIHEFPVIEIRFVTVRKSMMNPQIQQGETKTFQPLNLEYTRE